MKQVYTSEEFRVPIKSWIKDSEIEEGTLTQAENLARLPFAFRHVALMPDAHQGYGMPIGGVLATRGAIIPNAVGADIGCGMCAMRTSITQWDTETLKVTMQRIRDLVPTGFNHHDVPQAWEGFAWSPEIPVIQQELKSAQYQLGTLGGGNHFIELQKADDGHLWAMLHSGSRNFGLKIANVFHTQAKELCSRWWSDLPDKDLAFLPLGSNEYGYYDSAMTYALAFAKESRARMMQKIRVALDCAFSGVVFEPPIDVHHNYARMESHFGENVLVHRKGATSARTGELGIIPGSQGTSSYIVRGLGNPESFTSCSHGAGRKMGRKQAQRELSLAGEIKRLNDLGVIHGIRSEKDLDEAAGAYKDIDAVMESQSDLVEIVTKLTPLAVIKA